MANGEKSRSKPRTRARETAADRAANVLRRRIVRGELAAGDSLPGERELSEQMGVSRLTLRTALTRLESEGLVHSSQGAATRVLDYRERGGLTILPELALVEMERGRVPTDLLRSMLEVRRVFAVEALGLVAERMNADDHARLRERLEEMRACIREPERFMVADMAFAREIVRSTKNVAMELLYNSIERLLIDQGFLRPTFLVNADGTLAAYEKLTCALEAGDPSEVRRAARTLLAELDAETLSRVGVTQLDDGALDSRPRRPS